MKICGIWLWRQSTLQQPFHRRFTWCHFAVSPLAPATRLLPDLVDRLAGEVLEIGGFSDGEIAMERHAQARGGMDDCVKHEPGEIRATECRMGVILSIQAHGMGTLVIQLPGVAGGRNESPLVLAGQLLVQPPHWRGVITR